MKQNDGSLEMTLHLPEAISKVISAHELISQFKVESTDGSIYSIREIIAVFMLFADEMQPTIDNIRSMRLIEGNDPIVNTWEVKDDA